MSVTPRTWLAVWLTAVLVTNAMGWARCERASRGTYAMAARSWMFRHRTMPWEHLRVARVRGILRHQGRTSGSLVSDDTDNPRSPSAQALASLETRRAKDRGGALWGPRRVFLGDPEPLPSRGRGLLAARP